MMYIAQMRYRVLLSTVLVVITASCGGRGSTATSPDLASHTPAAHVAASTKNAAASAKRPIAEPISIAAARAHREPLAAAIEAYRGQDFPAMLIQAREAAALAPQHPRPQLVLAVALARNQLGDDAIAILDHLAEAGMSVSSTTDPALAALTDTPAMQRVQAKMDKLNAPLGNSELAFTLPDPNLLAESLAFDAKDGSFLVSSVHQRKIIRRRRDGIVSDFTQAAHDNDIWAIFGIAIHGDRVWACSSAVPEMRDYIPAEHKGKTALLAFARDTGRPLARFEPPDDGHEHSFGDLLIDSRGTVYVSDSTSGAIYVLPAGALDRTGHNADARLHTLVEPGQLRSPQGLTLIDNESTLLVADYGFGIARIPLHHSSAASLKAPPSRPGTSLDVPAAPSITYLDTASYSKSDSHTRPFLVGIDGLIAHGDDLIGIQNGLTPHRIVRITLDPGHSYIEHIKPEIMNHASFAEPTVGIMVTAGPNHDHPPGLYYIANSQWGKFGPRADTMPARVPPAILRWTP